MTTRYDLAGVTATAGDLIQTGVNAVYAYDLNLVNSLLFDTTNDLIDIDYQDKAFTQIVSNLDNAELRYDSKSISLNLNFDGLSLETINQLQSYKTKQNYILLAELVNRKGVVLGLEMDKTKPFLRYKKSRSKVSESGSSGKVSDGGSSPINRTKLKISFGNDDVIFMSDPFFFNSIGLNRMSFERAAVASISNTTITGVTQKKTDGVWSLFTDISNAAFTVGLKNYIYGEVTFLKIYSAALTKVNLINNAELTRLDLSSNNLAVLDLSRNLLLTNLLCNSNQISVLDVSALTNLTFLQCYTNQIAVLNVSALTNLTTLLCAINQITVLDVSALTSMSYLQCHTNQITVLDVSALTSLSVLLCYTNQITALDLSGSTLLTNVQIHLNELTAAVNSQALVDVDTHGLSNGYFKYSIYGGGSLTTAGAAAVTSLQGKGWTIVVA